MTTKWIELPTLQDVAKAQADGCEIEVISGGVLWEAWDGRWWGDDVSFRARPRQPKMKKVKMLCWLSIDNRLLWIREDNIVSSLWIRIPAQDIEIEIPEGV